MLRSNASAFHCTGSLAPVCVPVGSLKTAGVTRTSKTAAADDRGRSAVYANGGAHCIMACAGFT